MYDFYLRTSLYKTSQFLPLARVIIFDINIIPGYFLSLLSLPEIYFIISHCKMSPQNLFDPLLGLSIILFSIPFKFIIWKELSQ